MVTWPIRSIDMSIFFRLWMVNLRSVTSVVKVVSSAKCEETLTAVEGESVETLEHKPMQG